jgi:predicted TIM-barrel fold metal-dependent hydrolase
VICSALDAIRLNKTEEKMKAWTCFCGSEHTAKLPSRRSFLSGAAALGASALLPGCQTTATDRAANVAARPYRIDVHHHVMPPQYIAEATKLTGAPYPKWSPTISIEEMDRAGIATSVLGLVQPGASFGNAEVDRRLARESNDYAATLVRDFPGRFGLFATLPLLDTEGSLREIGYAMDTLKADGIGLMTSYGPKYLGDQQFWPIWEELNRRKAVIYTHPLMPACCKNPIQGLPPSAIEYGTDTTRTVASLLFTGTASRFSDIKWILSHSGGTLPMLWSRFMRQEDAIKDRQNVLPNGALFEVQRFYYDTAQANQAGAIAALRSIASTSQIMYGSDYPYRTATEAVKYLGERDFSAAERTAIDRGNAMRIMPTLRTLA